MRRLKDRIERRLGIIFGTFRTPVGRRNDFKLVVRLGYGEGRQWVNFEAAVAGRAIYVGRAATCPKEKTTIRDFRGRVVREVSRVQRSIS